MRKDYSRSPPPRRRFVLLGCDFSSIHQFISRSSRRGSSRDRDTGCLFIGNIPYDYTEHDIKSLFKWMGDIEYVTIGMNHRSGRPKGHAFVQFYDARDAQDTHREFQGRIIEGRALHIDWDAGKQRKMRMYDRRPYDRPYRRDYSPRRRRSPGRRFGSGRYEHSPIGRRGSPPRYSSRSPRRNSIERSPIMRGSMSPPLYGRVAERTPSPTFESRNGK